MLPGMTVAMIRPVAITPGTMQFAVMQPAQGDGEFIAYLASQGPLLGELDVVGVRRCATAGEAALRSDKPEVIAVTLPHRLCDDNHPLSAGFVPLRSAVII